VGTSARAQELPGGESWEEAFVWADENGEGIPAKNSVEDLRLGAPARAWVPAGDSASGFDVGGQG